MILNNAIIDDIKRNSGLLFDKAGDFGLLSTYTSVRDNKLCLKAL